jgi:hypothetical protein
MDNDEFLEAWSGWLSALGTRELDERHYERAIGYPWARPEGSFLLGGDGVEELAQDREILGRYTDPSSGRIPLLAYGANGSPERLAAKLAHLPADQRDALVLAGYLEGFDIGAVAHPPVWSSMAGTPITSPGTQVRVSILYLTDIQFTALWWTELSYRLGALERVVFKADLLDDPIDRVLLFVSRWGAFCLDGEPVAMSALPARDRRWRALSQEEILTAAARVALGEGSIARDLIKGAFENPAAFAAAHRPAFDAASLPFESELWREMPVDSA